MHISRARKRLDPGKIADARNRLLREHIQKMNHGFNAGRKTAEAIARAHLENHKTNKTHWVPMGVFDFTELVYCRFAYGEEITQQDDFWDFWRKANGQEFLKFA